MDGVSQIVAPHVFYQNLLPVSDNTIDIGTALLRFNDAFFGGVIDVTDSTNAVHGKIYSDLASTEFRIETTSNHILSFRTNALTRWSIGNGGNLNQDPTNGADIILRVTGTAIRAATGDGSDTLIWYLTAGGAVDLGGSRGAILQLTGNESANSGRFQLLGGNAGAACAIGTTGNSNLNVAANNLTIWSFAPGGNLSGSASNGGDVVFNRLGRTVSILRGTNGKADTVTLNGTTPVSVANTSITTGSTVIFTLRTVGGTVGAYPVIDTITANSGFTVKGTAGDTSTYTYAIIETA